ncbi:MAG: hypothetical protein JWM11_6898, partial [Planctomycetaceae bacterium]|nr:hypothetical protein [Planctomycetaceae bacterium]
MKILNRLIVCCFAACFAVVPATVFAGKSFSTVGRASGILAVQESADGPWRVVPTGGIVPDAAEIRTSADGSCQIHVAEGDSLFLGPLSRVKFDRTARRVHLLAGRVFSKSPAERTWTVLAGGLTVEGSAAGVETILLAENGVSVSALQGSGTVSSPGMEPVKLAEMTTRSWRDNKLLGDTVNLVKTQADQLAAWTTSLPQGQGPGQLVITDPQSKSQTRLGIARYHAELEIRPPVALVKLDQAFFNPLATQQEGEFIFNLPPGASVSRFAMFVTPTDLIEGEVIDRRKANQVYSDIVRQRRDPAILEQIGDNLFKMRVFPIFPRDVKRILLNYTLPLEGRGGQFHLQLPMLSNLEPIWDFRFHGAIHGPTPFASVQSPTHPEVNFDARGRNEIGFDFSRRHYRPTSDFMLAFQQSLPQRPTTYRSLVAEPLKLEKDTNSNDKGRFVVLGPQGNMQYDKDPWNDQPATYFLAELQAPVAAAKSQPADILILAETSSAMESLDTVRPALYSLVSNLREQDRFRLVCVDAGPRGLHEGWLKPGSPQAAAAMSQFEQQFCLGSLNLLEACKSVSAQFTESSKTEADRTRRKLVVYIGRGLDTTPNSSRAAKSAIVRDCQLELSKAKVNFWAVELSKPAVEATVSPQSGAGNGSSQVADSSANNASDQIQSGTTLQQLSAAARGRCFDFKIQTAEQKQFFEWVLAGTPSLSFVKELQVQAVESGSMIPGLDIYSAPSLLPGETIYITGRMPAPTKIKLSYSVEDSSAQRVAQSAELTAAADGNDHLVGRFWAEQRYQHLNSIFVAPTVEGGNQIALDAIVRLSREWNLLTPYTAFLVLENEQEYILWGVPRQARREYWSAKGVPLVEPLPRNWIANAAPERVLRGLGKQVTANAADNLNIEESVNELFKSVRLALDEGRLDSADRSLNLLLNLRAQGRPEYRQLRDVLSAARKEDAALNEFGLRKQWFDPTVTHAPMLFGLDRILMAQQALPESITGQNPLGEALLREVDLPGGEMTIEEFAKWLKPRLRTNVFIDKVRLEEETIATDRILVIPPLKRVTLQNALSIVLEPSNLDVVVRPRRITITTRADSRLNNQLRFYPLQNLLDANPKFEMADLYDSQLDRELAVKRRIDEKLRKPVSLKFVDATLNDVANRLRQELGENIVIRNDKLQEETISTDTQDVNLEVDNAQWGDALSWLLVPRNLGYQIRHDALVITTKADATLMKPLRIYPATGLVHRFRNPANAGLGNRHFPGMGGGMGGMSGGMGGMGFGMGGMSGGMGGMSGGMGGMGGGMGGMGGGVGGGGGGVGGGGGGVGGGGGGV